jgi:hypothetical protein
MVETDIERNPNPALRNRKGSLLVAMLNQLTETQCQNRRTKESVMNGCAVEVLSLPGRERMNENTMSCLRGMCSKQTTAPMI